MGNQKPFYICTAQFDIPKWINALLDIRSYVSTLSKKPLSFGINFWLRTPGLPLRLPVSSPYLFIVIGGMLRGNCLCAILLTHRASLFLKVPLKLSLNNYIPYQDVRS